MGLGWGWGVVALLFFWGGGGWGGGGWGGGGCHLGVFKTIGFRCAWHGVRGIWRVAAAAFAPQPTATSLILAYLVRAQSQGIRDSCKSHTFSCKHISGTQAQISPDLW